jgi:hypothetical protein
MEIAPRTTRFRSQPVEAFKDTYGPIARLVRGIFRKFHWPYDVYRFLTLIISREGDFHSHNAGDLTMKGPALHEDPTSFDDEET